ncbi:MAG: hypothetical protein C0603_03445 [Denitrovibrio sp.]|nr:MAG: hypothetical protein C0603_03445 [Denitrovibrio sp.]
MIKILVVDDDNFTRKLLKSMFDSIEVDVSFAENGSKGLEAVRELGPDIVISDYNMPGMTGLEMLQHIREEFPHIKLVLMTIYTEADILIRAINQGIDRFLEKPVMKVKLENVLALLADDIKFAREVQKYQNLLKAYRRGVDSSTIFSLLDAEGNFTYVNENLCIASKYLNSELIGKHFSMIKTKIQLEQVEFIPLTEESTDKIWHNFVKNIDKHGQEYVTELNLFPVYAKGEITGYISIEKDMSDVVINHRKHLQDFFNADSSIMFAYNKDSELVLCNNAFLDFFNFNSLENAVSNRFRLSRYANEFIDINNIESMSLREEAEIIKSFLECGENKILRKVNLKRSEESDEFTFTVSCFNLDQSYLGLDDLNIVRLNNITELENLRKEELTGAMLASIGKLSAGITHEINTPLTYIKGNIELLEGDIEDCVDEGTFEEMKDYFDSINDGIVRISAIIESMKEVTGEASFEKTNGNLYSTFVVTGKILFNRAKYIAPIYLNGTLLNLESDPNKEAFMLNMASKMLEQVWIILINNSLDQLSHSDLTFQEKYININVERLEDKRYRILIADNGGGINPSMMNRIFDLFTSTKKHKGMGIGLNIAKSIIDKHDGSIRPYNDNGGAVFEIII